MMQQHAGKKLSPILVAVSADKVADRTLKRPIENNLSNRMQALADASPRVTQLRTMQAISATASTQPTWGTKVVQLVQKTVAGITVTTDDQGGYPEWNMAGSTWHLNFRTDPYHVTQDGNPKQHFYYKRDGDKIKDAVSGQRGKKKFSQLPAEVKDFIIDNYENL